MTIENYTNTELLLAIQQLNYSAKKISKLIKYGKHNPLIEELIRRTTFLDEFFKQKNKPTPFLARLYCIEHDITEHPTCNHPDCHSKVTWNNGTREFCHHCCCTCGATDPIVQEKLKQTNIDRRGVEYSTQSDETKQKYKQTCIEKWGVDNTFKSDEIKQRIRCIQTERYGGVGFASDEINEKIKQSMIETFGVSHPSQSQEIKDKIVQTCLLRFGVKHPTQSNEIKERIKQTNLEKRGVEWVMQSQEVRDKSKETNMKTYGYENPMQSKEIQDRSKQSCLQKYGVEYSFQSDIVKERGKQTCKLKYGVDNYSKCSEFHKKAHKRYSNQKYPDMTFASSWEFQLYDFLTEHHIEFEYQPAISFEYECDGKTHTYHPDFKVGDKIIEVKGDHFFRINESIGQEEMYCPFRKRNGQMISTIGCVRKKKPNINA